MAILWHNPDEVELNPDKKHQDFFLSPEVHKQYYAKIHKAGAAYRVYVPPAILQQLELSPLNNICWLSNDHLYKLPAENAKQRTITFVPAARTAFLQLNKTIVGKYPHATHIRFDIESKNVIKFVFTNGAEMASTVNKTS